MWRLRTQRMNVAVRKISAQKKPGRSRAFFRCGRNRGARYRAEYRAQGAMRVVIVSLWNEASSRNWNQPPLPLSAFAVALLSLVAKSCQEL